MIYEGNENDLQFFRTLCKKRPWGYFYFPVKIDYRNIKGEQMDSKQQFWGLKGSFRLIKDLN
jgi:hypothetical protein